jgi:hypothetical protein
MRLALLRNKSSTGLVELPAHTSAAVTAIGAPAATKSRLRTGGRDIPAFRPAGLVELLAVASAVVTAIGAPAATGSRASAR